jgi:hypothetical protein
MVVQKASAAAVGAAVVEVVEIAVSVLLPQCELLLLLAAQLLLPVLALLLLAQMNYYRLGCCTVYYYRCWIVHSYYYRCIINASTCVWWTVVSSSNRSISI